MLTAWGVLAEGEAGRWRSVRAEELEQLGANKLGLRAARLSALTPRAHLRGFFYAPRKAAGALGDQHQGRIAIGPPWTATYACRDAG